MVQEIGASLLYRRLTENPDGRSVLSDVDELRRVQFGKFYRLVADERGVSRRLLQMFATFRDHHTFE